MLKYIGFDLDDTLYDRNGAYEKAFEKMESSILTTHLSFDEFNPIYQRKSIEEHDKYALGQKKRIDYQTDRFIATYAHFGYRLTKDQAIIFNALYQYYRDYIQLRPGAEAFIEFLKQRGYTVFLFTNGPTMSQRNKISTLKLERLFDSDHIFISDEIGYSKPNPASYQYISDQLDAAVDEILYIGDDYLNDVTAPRSMGWQAIYFNFLGDNHMDDPFQVRNFLELQEALFTQLA